MDYCYTCRRQLNGALACAGCGAPADGPDSRPLPEPGICELDLREHDRPAGHRRTLQRPNRARRARRRSWRRTALLVTLGAVLAAGALSLAELATEAPQDKAVPVKVKDQQTEPPGPGGDESERPGRPSAVAGPRQSTAAGTGAPGTGSAAPTTSASTGPGPGTTVSSAAPRPTLSSPVTSAPGQSENPSEQPPPHPGTQRPPPPKPTPTPTETCTRFLWWCT